MSLLLRIRTYLVWLELAVRRTTVRLPLRRSRDVDNAIYNDVSDVHALGAELTRKRLRQRPLSEFASGEEAEARRPFE